MELLKINDLFDVAIVFALALTIALVSNLKMADLLTTKDFTRVKTRQGGHGEHAEGCKVSRYVAVDTPASISGGQRVGTAYRLESGEMVRMPEEGAGAFTR